MKVIQIGLGGMGNTWLKTVLSSSEVEYAGFVEINPAIARQQAQQYNLDSRLIFNSLPQALAAVAAQGVINVTPPAFHREISLMALEAGLPVLSEKPLADSMASAREIVAKADEAGVLHMVAQNYRYHAPVQTLKQLLSSGQLGRIGAVTVEFFKGPHFGGFREGMAYPLIIDMAIHHFDLMRFLVESEPLTVYGRSWNPPWSWYQGDASASVLFQFANQVVISYNGSWCSTAQETPWNANWRFEGEQGVAWLQDDQVYLQLKGATPQNPGSYWHFNHEAVRLIEPASPESSAQTYLLHEFFQALTEGIPPATTCQDNIKSLAMVFNTIQSFETNSVVRCGESWAK